MHQSIRELSTVEVISSLSSHIAIIDRQGIIILVNQRWKIFCQENDGSQSISTNIGANYLTVCLSSANQGDEDAKKAYDGIQSVLSGSQREFYLEYPCHSPTEQRWFSVRVSAISKNSLGAVIAHDNITRRKLAEIALEAKIAQVSLLNDELDEKVRERTKSLKKKELELEKALANERELGELKSRFVSMASHEFRTPLSSILSSAALISKYTETDQQDKRMKHVHRIGSSVDNLTAILKDFLSLEKLEAGKISSKKSEVDFLELVTSVLEEIKLATKKDQHIFHHHSGKSIAIVNEHLAKNILLNLLSNAIKYSSTGKNIDLTSEINRESVTIKVKDRGIGIPQADHEHMFTRFFRATNVIAIQGTGLGLTIVKRYLDLMNGTISFVSKEHEGSTFRVEIPQ
jgi:signal transduction histidine kinase